MSSSCSGRPAPSLARYGMAPRSTSSCRRTNRSSNSSPPLVSRATAARSTRSAESSCSRRRARRCGRTKGWRGCVASDGREGHPLRHRQSAARPLWTRGRGGAPQGGALGGPPAATRARRQRLASRAVRHDRGCGRRHHCVFARPRADLGGSWHLALIPDTQSALAPAHGGLERAGPGAGRFYDYSRVRRHARSCSASASCFRSRRMDWSAAHVSVALGVTTVGLLLPGGSGPATPWPGGTSRQGDRRGRGGDPADPAADRPRLLPAPGVQHGVGAGSRLPAGRGHALAFSFPGLVLASAIANIPFVVQPIQRAFESVPADVRERRRAAASRHGSASCESRRPWRGPGSSRRRSSPCAHAR